MNAKTSGSRQSESAWFGLYGGWSNFSLTKLPNKVLCVTWSTELSFVIKQHDSIAKLPSPNVLYSMQKISYSVIACGCINCLETQ